MAAIGLALSGIGSLIALVGVIMLCILAFKKSALWGIGVLCCPIVPIIFAVQNWAEAKNPFLIWAAGAVLGIIGNVITASQQGGMQM